MNKVFIGDCRDVMRDLIARGVKVQTCVTSPPYWGLRDYGVAGQLGLEATPQEYVERMVEVFRLVRELLADDGTLWLNIGDSYAGSWGNYGGQNRTAGKQRAISAGSRVPNPAWDERTKFKPAAATPPEGLKNKDLVGIPWRVAFALQADGWYLRSEIIWHKVAPMPESVRDRPTRAHEQVFLLAKSEKYFYNTEAARDPLKDTSIARLTQPNYEEQEGSERGNGGAKTNGKMKAVAAHFGGRNKSQLNDQTRLASGNEWNQDPAAGANWRDVWPIAADGYREAHFAVMPSKLVERCILAGSRTGDIVFDPFFGSGTTGEVAQRLGRQWIGIELNPAYEPLQKKRTQQTGMIF